MWGRRERIRNLSRILWGGGWVDHFNQLVFHPLGVELYRKILGRSNRSDVIGLHFFVKNIMKRVLV